MFLFVYLSVFVVMVVLRVRVVHEVFMFIV